MIVEWNFIKISLVIIFVGCLLILVNTIRKVNHVSSLYQDNQVSWKRTIYLILLTNFFCYKCEYIQLEKKLSKSLQAAGKNKKIPIALPSVPRTLHYSWYYRPSITDQFILTNYHKNVNLNVLQVRLHFFSYTIFFHTLFLAANKSEVLFLA